MNQLTGSTISSEYGYLSSLTSWGRFSVITGNMPVSIVWFVPKLSTNCINSLARASNMPFSSMWAAAYDAQIELTLLSSILMSISVASAPKWPKGLYSNLLRSSTSANLPSNVYIFDEWLLIIRWYIINYQNLIYI